MGIVSEYLFNVIAKQVDDNGVVVWYDPDGVYAAAAKALNLTDRTILRYECSFVRHRWEIDQRKLIAGEDPPRLVVMFRSPRTRPIMPLSSWKLRA